MTFKPSFVLVFASALLAGSLLAQSLAKQAASKSSGLRQTAYIKSSNPHGNNHFGNGGTLDGRGVAVSGDGSTLAVGAPYESSASKGVNGDQQDTSLYSAGAVYVFTHPRKDPSAWVQQAYIKASNPGISFRFGHVVSLSRDGNTLAVSSFYEASDTRGINGNQRDQSIPQAGAVYTFTRKGGVWTQQGYIKASNTGEKSTDSAPDEGDQFGFSMALSADANTLAVGAISEDSAAKGINGDQTNNSAPSSGAVYLFTRNGNNWSQQAYVKASNADPMDLFGYAVGLSADGNTLAVSSYDEDSSARGVNGVQDHGRRGSGAVFVFTRTEKNWAQTGYLKASNAEAGDSMGYDLAISEDGNTIAVGAGDEDCLAGGINPSGCDSDVKTDTSTGAVYVFFREANSWQQQAFIKASHPGKEDTFGSRLNLSGDGNTLAVGAPFENGNSKGINRDEADLRAEDSGAVYLFRRTGAIWNQDAYIKASNAQAGSEFGGSMSLSSDGKLLIVGAQNDSSGSKGVNGNEQDTSMMGAGAVYVFAR